MYLIWWILRQCDWWDTYGVGSVINGMFAVMEMKKVENVRKRMKYEAWVSFIAGVMILIPILMFLFLDKELE